MVLRNKIQAVQTALILKGFKEVNEGVWLFKRNGKFIKISVYPDGDIMGNFNGERLMHLPFEKLMEGLNYLKGPNEDTTRVLFF